MIFCHEGFSLKKASIHLWFSSGIIVQVMYIITPPLERVVAAAFNNLSWREEKVSISSGFLFHFISGLRERTPRPEQGTSRRTVEGEFFPHRGMVASHTKRGGGVIPSLAVPFFNRTRELCFISLANREEVREDSISRDVFPPPPAHASQRGGVHFSGERSSSTVWDPMDWREMIPLFSRWTICSQGRDSKANPQGVL